MSNRFVFYIQVGLLLATPVAKAQPSGSSIEHHEIEKKPAREIGVLLDSKEHRAALTREIKPERGLDGNLNLLKACSDVGITCGLELNSEMLGLLKGVAEKRYTLQGLFRETLGGQAKATWRLQEYVGRPTPEGYAPFYVLTIQPKHGATILDKDVVWNVGSSAGGQRDAYKLGKMAGLDVEKPASSLYRYSGLVGDRSVHMSARDALNHIAAMANISWQVVHSTDNTTGTLSIFPGKK